MNIILIKTLKRMTASQWLQKRKGASKTLDLTDYEKAFQWSKKYILEDVTDAELKKRVRIYVDLFKKINAKSKETFYRAVCINSLKDLNTNAIGIYWSYSKEGVPDCPYGDKSLPTYTLTAQVDTNDIDWSSFENFIAFGEDESEIQIYHRSNILITAIDKNGAPIKLKKAIKARI